MNTDTRDVQRTTLRISCSYKFVLHVSSTDPVAILHVIACLAADQLYCNHWHTSLGSFQENFSQNLVTSTGRMGWMAHRKWKESKHQPSMLPGPAVPGCCLISFHFLWAIQLIRPV